MGGGYSKSKVTGMIEGFLGIRKWGFRGVREFWEGFWGIRKWGFRGVREFWEGFWGIRKWGFRGVREFWEGFSTGAFLGSET